MQMQICVAMDSCATAPAYVPCLPQSMGPVTSQVSHCDLESVQDPAEPRALHPCLNNPFLTVILHAGDCQSGLSCFSNHACFIPLTDGDYCSVSGKTYLAKPQCELVQVRCRYSAVVAQSLAGRVIKLLYHAS